MCDQNITFEVPNIIMDNCPIDGHLHEPGPVGSKGDPGFRGKRGGYKKCPLCNNFGVRGPDGSATPSVPFRPNEEII